MEIRAFRPDDLAGIVSLWNGCVSRGEVLYRPLVPAYFEEKFLNQPGTEIFIADEAGTAIGFLAGYYSGAPHVVNLMLDEGLFGFWGITRLMDMLLEAANTTSSLEACIERYGLII